MKAEGMYSVCIATVPILLYMCTYFSQKLVSVTTLKLFFAAKIPSAN